MKKRVLSMFMALALCLTLLPTAAFAGGEDVSISGGVIGGGETGGEGGGVLVPPGGSTGEGGGIYVAPGSPTEGGGGTSISEGDTQTEIWCVSKPSLIQRSYDGTTDGGTIPIDLTFTDDGTNEIKLKEGTGFTAKKTFDSADAGRRTVTVEIKLIGDAAAKYKLKAGEEKFEIGGNINKAYPDLTVSLSKAACAVGEKILPLLSVEGAPEGAAVTYYYTQYKPIAGSSEYEGSEDMPEIDEKTAISEPGTYYVYAKTGETKNYEEERSTTAELTVNEAVVEAASVTKADGTDGGTYASLPAALNAAQDGDTVKLLADHVTDADALNALGENFTFEQYTSIVPVVTKTLTLDLNHKTVDYLEVGFSETNEETQEKETLATGNLTVTGEPAYGRILNLAFMDGALDIQSGEIGGILVDDNGVESPGGGLVCDVNSGSVTISGGTVLGLTVLEGAAVTVNGGSAHAGAWLNDSTLNITGGTFGNVRFRNNGGTIAISGGTFDTITNTNGSGSIPLMPLLADNYAFYKGDNAQNSTEKTLTNVTVRPHTHSFENGKCDCGASYVASVTASGGESTNYTSLDDALDAVKDGDTVTLLSGAEITRWHSLSKAFTLELNGKTATTQLNAELYLHAQVTVQDSSTGKTGGMAGTALLNVQSNGDLTIQSGTFNGRITINDGKLTIKGGTFNQEVDLPRGDSDSVFFSGGTFAKIWYPNSSGSFLDLLADGCAFYDNNNQLVNTANSTGRYLRNVKVKEHQHSFTDGACACGYTCPHTSVDANGACTVCGKQFAASITEGDDVTYYDTFDSALFYATRNDGCTLKLLADVTGTTVMINNPFIFDLNGHSVDALSVDAKATIKDSGTTKGRIGKVTVSNEKMTDLTLGSLLEEGYAFKYENGYWADDSHKETISGLKVTVEEAPIKSVVLDAIGADKKEVPTTMAYGTTGAVTLEASCWINDMTVPTYTWYKLEGAAATAPMEGVNGVKYKLPADLPAGKHTYLVTCTSGGYSKSAEITITVTKIDIANVPEDQIELELAYGGNVQYDINGEPTKDGIHPTRMALSPVEPFKVNGSVLNENDYTLEGNVQYGVGEYTLKINVDTAIYTGSIERTWHVIPRKLGLPGFLQGDYEKTYDGGTALPEGITYFNGYFEEAGKDYFLSPTNLKPSDYTLTNVAFENATVGKDKRISLTLQLLNKNYEFNTSYIEGLAKDGITVTADSITYTNCIMPRSVHFNITPATMPDFDKEVTLDIVNGLAHTYTIDLLALPALDGEKTYGDTQYEVDQSSVKELTQGYNAIQDVGFAVNPDNGKTQLTFHAPAVENQTEGSVGAIKITVTPTNYKPVTLTVNLRSVNKRKLGMFVSVATDPIVYGMTLGDIKLSADATVDNQVIPGTIAWDDPLTTVPAAGQATYRWTFTPDDTLHYLTASNAITFSVDKATPTGAPTYAAITTGGKTLADAPLTPNASWPSGTVQWVDKDGKPLPAATQVQANTEYTWSFTPADAANYNGATGSVTLYAVSSGGGGSDRDNSGSTGKTETTTKPDGTTVKTETRADGTVIETTTGKDGSVSKTTTNPNGSSVTETKAADGSTGTVKTDKHGQTTAETTLSSKAIETAKKSGEAVKAPVEVEASRDSNTAPTVKIELPRNSGDTKVEIPVSNVKPGTVAVLVHADGTEEIVKDSIPTENGIQLTVNGGATVKIVNNSKDFIDTQDHWAKDAIDFVSARELVNGISATRYAPDASATRAQLWTILARQNDADLNGGNTWYEKAQLWSKNKGISDGTEPNAAINRAQMVTMLWRAAGSPAAQSGTAFQDVAAGSYYVQAVAWAVEGGITAGVGGGRFDPNSTCTRGQIATFLYRTYQGK